ncbi:MAG: ATP-binding protein [Acidimicrobiales bacterium]
MRHTGYLRGNRPPLRRPGGERLVGGVAAGIARHFHTSTSVVRILFVIAGLASGVGLIVYAVAWLLMPEDSADEAIGRRALRDPTGITIAVALLPLVFVGVLVGEAFSVVGSLAWPTFLAPAVLWLVWRNGDQADRLIFQRAAEPVRQLIQPRAGGRVNSLLARAAVSLALALAGLILLVEHGRVSKQTVQPLAGLFFVIAALVVLFGPWWLRIARDLVLERQARARAEERADMAARVHDSVLQTLALIQRRADQPNQVVQLARAQERELRSWLFEGTPGPGTATDRSFAAGLKRIQDEVEALHGLPVETVVVGDCPLDDSLRAMLAAAREALVNAAKWSGASTLSLFGEIDGNRVCVYVRDRGVGFVEQDTAGDRKGISESIRGRMTRHGGSASIRSVPGEGTEVALSMTASTRPASFKPGQEGSADGQHG